MRVYCAALVLLALSACGSDLPVEVPRSPIPAQRPMLGAAGVPPGGAAYVPCDTGGLNVRVDPHFYQPAAPFPTYSDPGGQAGDCGDLDFDNRTREFTLIYATAQASESPWKYWWRRGRLANDGTGNGLAQVRKVTVAQYAYDTAAIAMPLNSQYDAITALLLISSDGTIALNDSAFTSAQAGNPLFDAQNVNVQHWRHVDSPLLDSVKAEGPIVTLWWRNQFFVTGGRPIDSTIVFRNGLADTVLGPSATTYSETVSGAGTFTYQLKHVSTPHGILVTASPNSPASDSIAVTVGTACARLAESSGSTTTWKLADQYLSAGCSLTLGSNRRYRWLKTGDVQVAGWSADTLLDFAGHSLTGSQVVIVEDSTVGDSVKSRDTLSFAVGTDRLVLSGPTFITDKTKKTYVAYQNAAPTLHVGHWYERYDDGWQWYSMLASDNDTVTRIWPMGDYTVDVRQHKLQSGVLHRGRLHVIVCSSPDCEPNAPVAFVTSALQAETGLGVFGAGPVLSWGSASQRGAMRLYDLWGMPDRQTVFEDAAWLDGAGGRYVDPETGWGVTWVRREVELPEVRAFDFSVAGASLGPYVFGIAVDPDLGANAADDVASFDPSRGLMIVADGSSALGLLLRQGGEDALASAQEYGVRRWAPTTAEDLWTGQRVAGVQLVGTPRDVQLVLSAPPAVGPAIWQFVVIRGASAAEVRARVDAVVDRLR